MYPPGIVTRTCIVGGATAQESGDPLILSVVVASSRGLIWASTGWRLPSLPRLIASTVGSEATFELPVTSQAGYRSDSSPGTIIDVSAPGSYSHTYTATVTITTPAGKLVSQHVIGPFPLPAEDLSPVDLDTMLPVGTVAGGAVLVPDSWDARVAAAEAAVGNKVAKGELVINVRDYGAVGDGVADDKPAFDAAIATGKDLLIPPGTYQLSATVSPAPGTRWMLSQKATLRPTGDFTVLAMTPGSRVEGGKIDCAAITGYTSAAVTFIGLFGGGHKHVVSNMTILGPGITAGAAIKLATTSSGQCIDWVLVDNVHLSNFQRLIWIDGTRAGTWINGNTFDRLTLGNAYDAIYVDATGGLGADGNRFCYEGQATTGGNRIVYCSGDYNTFEGFAFDVGNSGLTQINVEFTNAASNNRVVGPHARSIDNGTHNSVAGRLWESTAEVALEPTGGFTSEPAGNIVVGVKAVGNQDDWLAWANYRFTLSQTAGPATTNSLAYAFNPDPSLVTAWPADAANVVFEVDMAAEKLIFPRLMGLVFEYALRPRRIKVELVDDANGTVVAYDTTTNDKDIVTFSVYGLTPAANTINRIRITLGDARGASIRLQRVWATSGNAVGRVWLRPGGVIYGDLPTTTGFGTKVATSASQRLGFWGASPVAQPAAVANATDAATVITQLNALLARLRGAGIIAT